MRGITLLLGACALSVSGVGSASDDHGEAEWGYKGDQGPAHWGDLNPQFATCKNGQSQSPINITASVKSALPVLSLDYGDTELEVLNNGHAVQVNYEEDATMTVAGEQFKLLQFHFHSPSEHQIDGRYFPLEMHAVHKNDKGELAVIGVMFELGNDNAALAPIWEHMPEQGGKAFEVESIQVNANQLMPANKDHFRYMGSLTTPPCSEGVNWFVMQHPQEVSKEQIERFQEVMIKNNRPVQLRNGRFVLNGM